MFIRRMSKCLIELRAVKKFIRIIEKCLIELRVISSLIREL